MHLFTSINYNLNLFAVCFHTICLVIISSLNYAFCNKETKKNWHGVNRGIDWNGNDSPFYTPPPVSDGALCYPVRRPCFRRQYVSTSGF